MVTVSSFGHKIIAKIHFDDLDFQRGYNRVAAYGQSKLSNLLFTYELQRRLTAKGAPTIALAAHPGFSDTELMRHLPSFIPSPCGGRLRNPLRRVHWGPFALRPTRPRRAASTTDLTVLANCREIRKSLSQAHNRTMRIFSADCGRYPRSSPA